MLVSIISHILSRHSLRPFPLCFNFFCCWIAHWYNCIRGFCNVFTTAISDIVRVKNRYGHWHISKCDKTGCEIKWDHLHLNYSDDWSFWVILTFSAVQEKLNSTIIVGSTTFYPCGSPHFSRLIWGSTSSWSLVSAGVFHGDSSNVTPVYSAI